ncbi:MAG: FAD-dependent oxidoreductase [Gordonia sp. (in: high G+C Gram-positive bacteria)]
MKVCVVGAGPCGLTTVKQLVDEGHEVICHDHNPALGGLWLHADDDGSQTKAYDDLHLTISMKLMAYSDFPFTGERVFYTREQYLGYLRAYAAHFDLTRHIRFSSDVVDIIRTPDSWSVTTRPARTEPTASKTTESEPTATEPTATEPAGTDTAETTEHFDAVAVCSGPFTTPLRDIPGLDGFTGEIVHSAEYRTSERFRGKRVLVVGLADSGADIVRQISDVADTATLSIRSYSYLLPRLSSATRTSDHRIVRAHHHEMLRRSTPYPLQMATFWGQSTLAKTVFLTLAVILGILTTALAVPRVLMRRLLPRTRPPEPATNPFGEPVHPPKLDLGTLHNDANWSLIRQWNRRSHPDSTWAQRAIGATNVSFIPSIVSGTVALNDAGIADSTGSTVHFRDGQAADFDAIILCTGFTTEELAIGDLRVKDGNVRNLYKHFLHPEHDGTAAFIGFVRPFSGGIPICAEMQARYFALVCSGTLTPPANIDERIGREKEWEEHWTALSPHHPESIPSQVLYLDALAAEIGCLVPMSMMLRNPRLFIQLWFGSFNQACYRIVGPHSMGAAAVDDLYSEIVDNRREMALRMSLLQLMPTHMHPQHMM